MIDAVLLKKWLERRKKKLQEDNKNVVTLPNGMTIHIHMPQMPSPQKLPLSRDGKTLMTQTSVEKYPS